jgi:hypothetical protein
MQGDPETSDPVGQVGEWGFIAYLHCLIVEMPFRCKQVFPREKKCLLDLLRSVLQSFTLNLNCIYYTKINQKLIKT